MTGSTGEFSSLSELSPSSFLKYTSGIEITLGITASLVSSRYLATGWVLLLPSAPLVSSSHGLTQYLIPTREASQLCIFGL